jgi:putative ABC transport system permease protein
MRAGWFAREVLKSAGAQRVGAWLILIIAGLSVFIPMATSGQTDALENSIVAGLESRANRTLTLTRNSEASFPRSALDGVLAINAVEVAYGLGGIADFHNAAYTNAGATRGGNPVAVIPLHGNLADLAVVESGREPLPGEAVLTSSAMREAGLEYPSGALRSNSTRLRLRDDPRGDTPVVGQFRFVEGSSLGETIGIRIATEEDEITRLVVVARRFGDVTRLETMLRDVIGIDPSDIDVSSTAQFEAALAAIAGEVGRFNRSITLVSVGVGMIFLSLIVYGILQERRRDFGRRRTLGASRSLLIVLVTLQTLAIAIPGCIAGALVGWITAANLSGAEPSATFILDVTMLGLLAAVAAALPPATVAAFRDPVAALRVP